MWGYFLARGFGRQSVYEHEVVLQDAYLFVRNLIEIFVVYRVLAAIWVNKTNRNSVGYFEPNKVPLLTGSDLFFDIQLILIIIISSFLFTLPPLSSSLSSPPPPPCLFIAIGL